MISDDYGFTKERPKSFKNTSLVPIFLSKPNLSLLIIVIVSFMYNAKKNLLTRVKFKEKVCW